MNGNNVHTTEQNLDENFRSEVNIDGKKHRVAAPKSFFNDDIGSYGFMFRLFGARTDKIRK